MILNLRINQSISMVCSSIPGDTGSGDGVCVAQGPYLPTCCHPHPHEMTGMSPFFPSDSFLSSPLASKDGLALSHESLCLWPTRRLILSMGPDTSSRVSSRAHRSDRASYLESQQPLDLNRTQVLSLCFSGFKISFRFGG